jgi:hypothetical protein
MLNEARRDPDSEDGVEVSLTGQMHTSSEDGQHILALGPGGPLRLSGQAGLREKAATLGCFASLDLRPNRNCEQLVTRLQAFVTSR